MDRNACIFEQSILSVGGDLEKLFPSNPQPAISLAYSMTQAIASEATKVMAEPHSIGALAQLLSVLRAHQSGNASLKDARDAVRRIIVQGLKYDVDSAKLVDDIVNLKVPELQRFTNLSFRWLLKSISWQGMVAVAASLSSPVVTLRILLSHIRSVRVSGGNGTWSNFHDDYDFDVSDTIRLLEGLFPTQQIMDATMLNWGGPFRYGYLTGAAAAPTAQPAATSTTNTTNVPNSGVSNMNAATLNPVAVALSAINPALKPIIDGVLGQSGVSMGIDSILAEVNAKAQAEADLVKVRKDSEETIVQLRRTLAAAASMPQTMTIQANASVGIPSGRIDMVEAEVLFPQMAGLKLKVPHFVWDHAHPDVPPVNDDYIFRKEMLLKALRCLARNENFWLVGHTGSGKTTFVEQIAARIGWPVARVAFDSNVDRSELVGRMQLTADGNGGTNSSWLPGILERAITGNYILLCDELDAGHPNALYTLQPILEGKALTLLEDGGRVVPRSPFSRVCATGNTAGNGDSSGLYPACRILSAATLDRFQEFINVPYMTMPEEERLLSNSVPGLQKTLISRLVKFGNELRTAFIKGETPVSYSPRRSVAFARAVDDFSAMGMTDQKTIISLAFKSKLYDAASEDFRQRITEIANNTLGGVDPTITLS